MDKDRIFEALTQACGGADLSTQENHGEWFIEILPEHLRDAISALVQGNHVHHLSAITGWVDAEGSLCLLYHLFGGLTLRVRIAPAGDDTSGDVPTITDLVPAADWYEREVQDLTGWRFADHPRPDPLILPHDGPRPFGG
jgi:NADH:ubiquinone oxidoreductase subunit C